MRFSAVTASVALLACIVPLSVSLSPALAQSRIQFPPPNQTAPPMVPVNPSWGAGGYPAAGSWQPPGGRAPGASLGGTIQPFDPYALPGNFGGPPTSAPPGFPPSFSSQNPPAFSTPPSSVWPGQPPSLSVGPIPNLPPDGSQFAPGLSPISGSPYGTPTAPLNVNPSDPYFRGSPYATNPSYGQGAGSQTPSNGPPYQRLFQDTGLRGTYIFGRDKDDLSLTEAEISTTAYFPNFLGIPDGLRVTPGFIFHWTDGPAPPETSDIPARLYSGYLDFGIEPQFTPRFGAEVTARIGIYSDFQAFNNDSIRFLGTGVGVFQKTPNVAIKFGVAYLDRVRVKLLPAGGVLWTPNPQTRWDIFFPAPKLSNYWTTVGNQQVWWYVGGEYGGGSWSIEREGPPQMGANERIDINDIRIYLGIEWWQLNRYYGFAEVGYLFDREVVYHLVPSDSLNVDDSFMVRAGFSW